MSDAPIDVQRERFRAALSRAGTHELAPGAPRLSEGTGNVVLSLAAFESLTSPADRMLTGRVSFRQPVVRRDGEAVVLGVDEPSVYLTGASAIRLIRELVDALGGFDALLTKKEGLTHG